MSLFRKWKTHYKHKKFTTEDIFDGDDLDLSKPMRDALNIDDPQYKLKLADVLCNEDDDPNHIFGKYNIKYLGCTPIERKRSEKATAEAIKTVITNSKAGGRKIKNQNRIILNVSPDGIEVLDQTSQDRLFNYSIYNIFYCSVDANHERAFSFVSSEKDPLSEEERLSCHVFDCQKRKIAHDITLMVARCFENAYQHWRDVVDHHTKSEGTNSTDNSTNKENKGDLLDGTQSPQAVAHAPQRDNLNGNLLIDLASSDNEIRKYLQTTWVSFEDDSAES